MNFRHELVRKTIHLSATLCPLIYALIDRDLMLALLIPVTALFVLTDVVRQTVPPLQRFYDRYFGQLMRSDETGRLCGASHVMIAMLLCVLLFPKPVALAAMLFLSVSDALASVVGLRIGGPRWFEKSFAGSAAFFISAAVIGLACVWPAWLPALGAALAATVVEALPLRIGRARIDDNLSVPLSGGATLVGLMALLPGGSPG